MEEWKKFRVTFEYEAKVGPWIGTTKKEKDAWEEAKGDMLGDPSNFRKAKMKVEEVKRG